MPTTYAIPDGRVAMAATLYTGNSSTQTISNAVNGVSMQPDFVWVKGRSVAYNHYLYDSVRGTLKNLFSNLTNAEQTVASSLTSFDTNGFTVGSGTSSINASGSTYVAWQWKAGGTAVSNTAGSITSSVSANTTAGFSVLTYTGTGSAATVGHGLGVAPSMIIMRSRTSTGSNGNWVVYHTSLGATNYLVLNDTAASAANIGAFNNTSPTSSVFSVGTFTGTNGSSLGIIAYCFAPVAGYSAFGKYTGNGSADGPFVYTGLRPRFIMVKRTDSTGNWTIVDTSRNTSNVITNRLYADLSNAEDTDTPCDALSNGFKVRMTSTSWNASGGTYIYMAFAENPFKYANAR